MKNKSLLILIAVLLVLGACQRKEGAASVYHRYDQLVELSKPLAFGDDRDVYLFAGKENQARIGEILSASITRKVQLTAPEQYFYLLPTEGTKIKDFRTYKNLIYCGTMNGVDEVSNYLRGNLDKKLLQRVQTSGAELFVQKNITVRDQLLFFLLAKDAATLEQLATQRAGQVFDLLLERLGARLAYQAYTSAVIDNKLFAQLPYTIQIPQLYEIFSNDQENSFLSFVYKPRLPNRELPDKYISVHYEGMLQNLVTQDWLLAKRQELADQHFPGDKYLEEKVSVDSVRFAGHDALRLRGAWINKEMGGGVGGAFQTFAFWNAATQTVYVVDNIVYYPAGDKLPILLELGMLSESIAMK